MEFDHGGWDIWSGCCMTAKGKDPYFRFYAGDWLADTFVTSLSLEEQGAYVRLLCHQWEAGSIPTEPARVARLLGGNTTAWETLSEKFPGGRNQRLEVARADREKYREEQSVKSQLANDLRWAETRRKKAMEAHPQGDPTGDDSGIPPGTIRGSPNDPLSVSVSVSVPTTAAKPTTATDMGAAEPPLRAAKPARDPEPISAETAEILEALQALTGLSLNEKLYGENAKEVRLLVTKGGLKDKPGVPLAPPQPHKRILGALQWLATQPEVCGRKGSGDPFSWRPFISSIKALRTKWLSVERSAAEDHRGGANGQSRQFDIIDEAVSQYERDNP